MITKKPNQKEDLYRIHYTTNSTGFGKKKITEKWINDGITNLDMFAADVSEDCKQSDIAIVEAILEHMNKQIREDKESQKN